MLTSNNSQVLSKKFFGPKGLRPRIIQNRDGSTEWIAVNINLSLDFNEQIFRTNTDSRSNQFTKLSPMSPKATNLKNVTEVESEVEVDLDSETIKDNRETIIETEESDRSETFIFPSQSSLIEDIIDRLSKSTTPRPTDLRIVNVPDQTQSQTHSPTKSPGPDSLSSPPLTANSTKSIEDLLPPGPKSPTNPVISHRKYNRRREIPGPTPAEIHTMKQRLANRNHETPVFNGTPNMARLIRTRHLAEEDMSALGDAIFSSPYDRVKGKTSIMRDLGRLKRGREVGLGGLLPYESLDPSGLSDGEDVNQQKLSNLLDIKRMNSIRKRMERGYVSKNEEDLLHRVRKLESAGSENWELKHKVFTANAQVKQVQAEIEERIKELDEFSNYTEELKEMIEELQSDQIEMNQEKIRLTKSKEALEVEIAAIKSETGFPIDAEQEVAKWELKALDERVKLEQTRQDLFIIEHQEEDLQARLQETDLEKQALEVELQQDKREIQRLKDDLDHAEANQSMWKEYHNLHDEKEAHLAHIFLQNPKVSKGFIENMFVEFKRDWNVRLDEIEEKYRPYIKSRRPSRPKNVIDEERYEDLRRLMLRKNEEARKAQYKANEYRVKFDREVATKEELKDSISEADKAFRDSEKHILELEDDIIRLKKHLNELTSEEHYYAQEYEEAQVELVTHQQQISGLESKLKESAEELKNLKESAESREKNLNKEIENYEWETQAAADRIKELEAELKIAMDTQQNHDTKLTDAQLDLEYLHSRKEELKDRAIKSLEEQLRTYGQWKESLNDGNEKTLTKEEVVAWMDKNGLINEPIGRAPIEQTYDLRDLKSYELSLIHKDESTKTAMIQSLVSEVISLNAAQTRLFFEDTLVIIANFRNKSRRKFD